MGAALDPNDLGFDSRALAQRIGGAKAYEADPAAYKVDAENDPVARYAREIDAGARVTLNLACADGRREIIELDNAESRAWIRDALEDRVWFANRKIAERRFTVAAAAANRLRERKLTPTSQNLRPDEEAYLREFGAIEQKLVPLRKGGYRKAPLALSEAFVRAVDDPQIREAFFDGLAGTASAFYTSPRQREYLPVGGPAGQQLQISDVWDAQAKVYYAYTHDPIMRDAVEMLADFILGRGVQVVAEDQEVIQPLIDEFNKREKMAVRTHVMTSTLIQAGELFARLIPIGGGKLKVRTVPSETLWEIVTDSEDALDVFWYVQRFQSRTVLFSDNKPEAQGRWIERTIPKAEMLHVKINARESDVRGRSDMYPVLGWAKRLRDYFDAVVEKERAAAAYQFHLQVTGGPADVEAIAAAAVPGGEVQPGSTLVTNDQVTQTAVKSGVRTVAGDGSAYEALLNTIALAFGLTKEYFGAASHTNRASALVATEPAAKRFERRQDLIADFLRDLYEAVIGEATAAGLTQKAESLEFKIIFPQIVKADAKVRSDMLARAESMNWISKKRAAENAASELELDDYDFDEEQKQIAEEAGKPSTSVIARDFGQVTKGGPTPDEVAWDPGEVPNKDFAGADPEIPTPDAGDASPTSATGAKKIRTEVGRKTMERAIAEARKTRGIVIIP